MNKIVCFVALLAVSSTRALKHDGGARMFVNEINETLECVRGILSEGIPELGLPSFNPLQVAKLDLDFANFGPSSSGNMNVSGLILDGITGWQLTEAAVDVELEGGFDLVAQAVLNIPTLKVFTDYSANVSVSGVEVWGEGDIALQAGNLGVKVNAKLKLIPTHLEKIQILFSLQDFNIKFTGFFGSEEHSELVSKLLNDLAVRYVNEKSQDISDELEKIIKDLVNKPSRDGSTIIEVIMERCSKQEEFDRRYKE